MDRKVERLETNFPVRPKLLNVAAYGRVSSGKDAMLHSLSAQVSYYSDLIQSHPGWRYCGVYADEAMTGTKETRENFQRLLDDSREGKIDMIITKSISRFARNTVTLLNSVRELKELGVDVWFEEQNIHTMSGDGELMLTILAGYAQEESRSASENQKWRIRRSYEKGEVLQWRMLYGYRVSKYGVEINPEQAEIVREIFGRVIAGESFGSICRDLNARQQYSTFDCRWTTGRINFILQCEKYIGDALLQKTYVNNHIEKRRVRNNGELPMYYAEGSHEPIIDKETFEKAQVIVKKLNENSSGWKKQELHPFTGKIRCLRCGSNYKHVRKKGRAYWGCRTYQEKGRAVCPARQIPESILEKTAAEVLGLDAFDGDVFIELVERIEIPSEGRLMFIFRDGRAVERTWEYSSRSRSWTPEMKEKAMQKAINQRRNS